MCTPGRCKKTISCFSHGGTVWLPAAFPVSAAGATSGEASTVTGGGRSGVTSVNGAGDGSGIVGAVWTGATAEDCRAGVDSAVCVGVFSPLDGKSKYASAPAPNATTIAVPAINFRRDPKLISVACKSFCSGGWKECSSLDMRARASSWRRISASVADFSWRQGWRRKLIRVLKAALNKPICFELCLGKISPCHASSSCG